MTLRLRLTLLYTGLVAFVLAASGAGLYALLARDLDTALDTGLAETAELLGGYIDNEGERLTLREPDEPVPGLRPDLAAVLYDPGGRRRDSLGRTPAGLERTPPGFSTWGNWRVYTRTVPGGTLLTVRSRAEVEARLRGFRADVRTLLPLAVGAAFGLGYLVAGRALAPLGRLTNAAYDLAERRAWQERLPEPQQKDELWRLAGATNTLLGVLAATIERERRFTADAAHELRTPLTVLHGRLEKALEAVLEATTEPRPRASLEKALRASDDLLELTEKLLLLAHAEAGPGVLEPVALGEVACDSAELLEPLFAAKGLALTLSLPRSPVQVTGDRAALALAVRNLLENALKFTAAGEVVLSVRAEGGAAHLSVRDSGPGFPEEALPHLFTRFYQADVRHRRGGSGLGLALVSSVALRHGGAARAENVPGGGARFVLTLPLRGDAA